MDRPESDQCNLYNNLGNTLAVECVEAGCFWDEDNWNSPFCSSSEPASVKCDGKDEANCPSDCFWNLQSFDYPDFLPLCTHVEPEYSCVFYNNDGSKCL